MKAIHLFLRGYCKKSFTLPKVNFVYKNVEDSENKEPYKKYNEQINSKTKYNSANYKQSHQKHYPNFQSNSIDNTLATDKDARRQLYSRDLLEIESDVYFKNKFDKRRADKTSNSNFDRSWNNNKYRPNYQHRDKKVAKSGFHLQEDREIVYGIFPVLFALQSKKRSLYKLFLKNESSAKNEKCKLIQEICLDIGIPTEIVSKSVLQQLTNYDAVHQGVCLEASRLPIYFTDENMVEALITNDSKCWVYLNGINDPMNLGAILRTAYFMGVEKVLCSSTNSCPVTNVVSKASAGIAEVYPLFTVPNDESFLLTCQKLGWQIVSSSSSYTKNSIEIESFSPNKNVILVIGNEGRGISKEIFDISDACVSIPPHEKCSSEMLTLNASVASSIILFSIMSKLRSIGGIQSETSVNINH